MKIGVIAAAGKLGGRIVTEALVRGTNIRMISIAGAGYLFTDGSKTARVYERPEHPVFLKGISENTALGVQDVMAMEDVRYTFVSPGLSFDPDAPRGGDYLTGSEMVVAFNEDGASYTAYGDLAPAMVDFAEQGAFDRAFVTVLSRKGGN